MADSSTFKSLLRRRLSRAPLRYAAKPAFDGLVALELAVLRALDPVATEALGEGLRDVTAIIKTFERPALLRRLVASLRRHFPSMSIIVADDSAVPSRLPGVRTIALPFDSGVSAGRAAALSAVDSALTWVLDDDFVIYSGSRLNDVVRLFYEFSAVDVIGGQVFDLPLLSRRGSMFDPVYPTKATPRLPLGSKLGPVVVCDKVPNFFVARTESLRRVGWDSRLKRVEHADFFTRARGVLVTGLLPTFSCFHAQTPFDAVYMKRREDDAADRELLEARYFSAR